MLSRARFLTLCRWLIGIFFIIAGINHFRTPEVYQSMIPDFLPWHAELNLISGAAEVLGGIGILIPTFRVAAAWGLILLLIAVFPANIHVALNGWEGMSIPRWILWARLPFQGLFIAAVFVCCLKSRDKVPT